jgi:HPt (histidine-containing phosphotransfer) domain-containing protein
MADEAVYINIEEGTKRVMNNAKLYVRLLTKFRNETKLDDLDGALAGGDMEKAQAVAHTIKGTAANLSLTRLFNQTLELETQIKARAVDPSQLETVKTVFAQTMQEVDKVIAQNG